MAVFTAQPELKVETKTMKPINPKIFSKWHFTKKVGQPLA